jgi:hypothetical protein
VSTEQDVPPDPVVFGPSRELKRQSPGFEAVVASLLAHGYTQDQALDLAEGHRKPVITRAVQTCTACPSQWDAWDDHGQYWYLRYRSGFGSAEIQPTPDPDGWVFKPAEITFAWGHPLDGFIELARFARLAGITLALESPNGGESRNPQQDNQLRR